MSANPWIIYKDRSGRVLATIPAPEGVVVENTIVIVVDAMEGTKPRGVSTIRTEHNEQPRVRNLTIKDYRPVKKHPAGRFDPVEWLEANSKRLRSHGGRNWHPAWSN